MAARSVAVRAAVALGVALFTVGAVEIGARLYLGDDFAAGLPVGRPEEACARHDPDLGWVNLAGARTRVVAPKFRYDVAINSRGLRDREHEVEPSGEVFRVALLGDSVAWGWGVDDGLGFADLVEEELGPDVEVINLAVPGYSTDQELWMLEREGRSYAPDLVLLCFILNDVVGNASGEGHVGGKPRYVRTPAGDWALAGRPVPPPEEGEGEPAFRERLYARSAFLQLVRPPDAERQLAESAASVLPSAAPRHTQKAFNKYRAEIARLCEQIVAPDSVTRMLLGRLNAACETMGAPLVAFSVPHHHDRYLYQPGSMRPEIPAVGAYRTVLSRSLAQAGESLGFEVFSVDQALLDEVDQGHVLHVGDGHPNELGHRVLARRVVEELLPRVEAWRRGR